MKIRQISTMKKRDVIETVTSYFEEIDTRALVLDLKTTKDAEADYEAAKYLFGDQDSESETLENHEDLLEENEKLLIEYYKKQPEEYFHCSSHRPYACFDPYDESDILQDMAKDLIVMRTKDVTGGVTRMWKVYGAEGHRQRESFCDSWAHDWSGERYGVKIVECLNSDKTGTNDYSIMKITRNTAQECEDSFYGQLYDGAFENSRTGLIVELF